MVDKEFLLKFICKRAYWSERSPASLYRLLKDWDYEDLELIADSIIEGGRG